MFETHSQKPEFNNTYQSFNADTISDKLRINFVRKVFGITGLQLAFTTLFTFVCINYFDFKRFNEKHTGLLLLSALTSLVTALLLGFSNTLSKKVPVNYALLGLFTLGESYVIAFISSQYNPEIVLMALFLTAAVVTGLSLYALKSKTEITYIGGLIVLLAVGLLVAGIFSWFVRLRILDSLIFFASAVLSGLYLIYDIKVIMGREGIKLSLDDYIRGALHLYVDIIRIFIKILEILANNAEKKENEKKKRN